MLSIELLSRRRPHIAAPACRSHSRWWPFDFGARGAGRPLVSLQGRVCIGGRGVPAAFAGEGDGTLDRFLDRLLSLPWTYRFVLDILFLCLLLHFIFAVQFTQIEL
jgi:hypothetical protein